MRKLYLLIIVAFLSMQAGAQSFLHFTQTSFNLGTLTDTNQLYSLPPDTLYNTSSQTITDTVYLGANVNSDTLGVIGFIPFSLASPLDTNGTPSSKKAFFTTLPFNNPSFVSGPNGVVIWPIYIGGHAGTQDSIHISVTLTPVAGLDEAPLAKMYLVQRAGTLSIYFGDFQNIVQQVSLYDLNGQRLFSGSTNDSQSIPVMGWSEGVYFCEITTYRGERRTIKFVLQ
ncbi:MAG: hypothetical protein JWO03_2606 [Bacteroidetes bacterium]|nr:hypothetical protein [Bacteroidota bacterium]